MSLWRGQNSTLETLASLQSFMRMPQTVLVDMNFDTIPRGKPNVLCLVRHWVQEDDVGYGEEIGTTWRLDPDDEEEDAVPIRVEWTGGGHGVRDDEARIFHRFIMYDEKTSEVAIRRAIRLRNVIAMKRVSIPRPPAPSDPILSDSCSVLLLQSEHMSHDL